MVEEEGEIFRQGTVLLGSEEMEREYAGEDLRRKVRFVSVSVPGLRLFPIARFYPICTRYFLQLLEATVKCLPRRSHRL